ncbi:MAG: hypothetical protein AAFY11_05315 [Cyanobacteria bacterium J06641_5]
MKRFTYALNALCLPLIAAIAFATVVVAESESLAAASVRTAYAPAASVSATHNSRPGTQSMPQTGDLSR